MTTIRLHTELGAHFPDIAEILHVFYPQADIVRGREDACDIAHLHREDADGWLEDIFRWGDASFRWTSRLAGDHWEQKRRRKRAMKQCAYYLLRQMTGMHPPWGSLTGIRPTRLFYERLARGNGYDEAHDALIHLFDLRPDKAQLVEDTVRTQRGLIASSPRAVDVYVGIPFCVTRCAYCSFFAEAVGDGAMVPPYLQALEREIQAIARIAGGKGLLERALYVGGGTPTALTPPQLRRLLTQLRRLFPNAREFTVEAGRPDTITREHLAAMRESGVTRLCINPQTMNDATLARIGRAHTAWDTEKAFARAREMGFANINMDVIAALPEETASDFAKTLRAVEALAPDGLTVHALARKHGSRLNEVGYAPTDSAEAEKMVEMGQAAAEGMGMRPYYLYRQKYVAGNLENVGYAQGGKESLYNIDLMEETTSVLAAGAGAISKRIFHDENRIERAPNVGDVGHYLTRTDEMIRRKETLWG